MRQIEFQDAFRVGRVIVNSGIKEEFSTAFQKGMESGKDLKEVGIDLLFLLLNSALEEKMEEEIYGFLADVYEMKPEEVRHMNLKETSEYLEKLIEENDIKSFFSLVKKQVMK